MSKNIHFRRIPDHIGRELNGIKAPFVVVSTTLKLSIDDIARGKYRKLGITIRDGQVACSPSLVPHVANGYYSKYNRYGREISLKHLPKVYKTDHWETPNFGDPSKGIMTTIAHILLGRVSSLRHVTGLYHSIFSRMVRTMY